MNKKFTQNKRGSHVGVILSFMIFVTFLIFMFSILEPAVKTDQEKESLLNFLENEIIDYVTKDVVTSVIGLEDIDKVQGCINLNSPVNILGLGMPLSIIIKDSSEGVAGYELNGEIISIDKPIGENFLKFFYLGVLPAATTSTCTGYFELFEDYQVAYTRTTSQIYKSEIKTLITNNQVTNNLNGVFDTTNEIGLKFEDSDGVILETTPPEISSNVYSKEINIEYIDEEATIKPGRLTISVW